MGWLSDFNWANGPLVVRKEPLDSGGYTKEGKYFGIPSNLWKVIDDSGYEHHFRAQNLKMAKQIAKALYPDATWSSRR